MKTWRAEVYVETPDHAWAIMEIEVQADRIRAAEDAAIVKVRKMVLPHIAISINGVREA